jgi:regulator of protease activity HflC (stomatin/prohibitin superfamily)
MIIPSSFMLGLMFAFILLLLFCLLKSFFTIDQGHVGILQTFGRVHTTKHFSENALQLIGPGAHWKWPWQKVQKMAMMEQCLDLSENSHEDKSVHALASDGTPWHLSVNLRFSPKNEQLYDYLFTLKEPVAHIRGLFLGLLRNEVAVHDINLRQERGQLHQSFARHSQEWLEDKYGITFESLDLLNVEPPEELGQALNAVLNAHLEDETLYARAEAEYQQKVLAAEMGIAIAEANAKALEKEIMTLSHYLEELQCHGTLQLYVDRRKSEVLHDSRDVFIRRS